MCWDADELLTGLVNNVEDGSVAIGRRKLFNEVKGNGMPCNCTPKGDNKLSECELSDG